jgi:hypothetical protein
VRTTVYVVQQQGFDKEAYLEGANLFYQEFIAHLKLRHCMRRHGTVHQQMLCTDQWWQAKMRFREMKDYLFGDLLPSYWPTSLKS